MLNVPMLLTNCYVIIVCFYGFVQTVHTVVCKRSDQICVSRHQQPYVAVVTTWAPVTTYAGGAAFQCKSMRNANPSSHPPNNGVVESQSG